MHVGYRISQTKMVHTFIKRLLLLDPAHGDVVSQADWRRQGLGRTLFACSHFERILYWLKTEPDVD
jgi:hypothetical protein